MLRSVQMGKIYVGMALKKLDQPTIANIVISEGNYDLRKMALEKLYDQNALE